MAHEMSYEGFRFGQDLKKRKVRNKNICSNELEIPDMDHKSVYVCKTISMLIWW